MRIQGSENPKKQKEVFKMAKVLVVAVVVLLAIIDASRAESCNYDSDCIGHYISGAHCCEDNQCYAEGEACPVIKELAGGIIAAIVIGVIVFIGIIVGIIACCCCACCQTTRPGRVIVTQPGYQQFGVSTTTTTTNAFQPTVPQPGYAQPQPPPPQGYPPPYNQGPPPPQFKS